MEAPPGFDESFKGDKACKLKKTLYGLKWSSRAWFGRFSKALIKQGFWQSQRDHILSMKLSLSRMVTDLVVYIDDIAVTGDALEEIELFKK